VPCFQKKITIINKLGLHARAATKLAQLSSQFEAKITIELEENQADASSIMGLMLLAGGQGKTVKIITENIKQDSNDAEAALNSICQLISDKFEETE
jgi:phosphotransferase system HPr (HPr) family protein